jgi:hypothetical protein
MNRTKPAIKLLRPLHTVFANCQVVFRSKMRARRVGALVRGAGKKRAPEERHGRSSRPSDLGLVVFQSPAPSEDVKNLGCGHHQRSQNVPRHVRTGYQARPANEWHK